MVDVGGFRTTPEAARKIGKHPDQLAQQATQQVPQSAPQPPAGDSGESTGTSEASADGQSEGAVSEPLMSPEGYEHSIEAVDAVAVLHENIPASVQVAAISRIADAGGDLNAGGLDGIAADLGLNAEALRSMSSTVFDNFAEQARHFCYKHNVDPDAFYEFARDREGAFSEAVTRQTSNQDLSGWANLIGQFKQSDDFRPAWSPERLMAHRWPAGYHVRQVPGTNEVLIAVPGRGEMELATALRLGIVNVPR